MNRIANGQDVSPRKVQTVCLVALTLMAAGFTLYFVKTVILPLIIAVFLVIGCRPIMDWLEDKLKLHWTLAFAATFLVGLLVLVVVSFLTWLSIKDLSDNAVDYQQRISAITQWVQDHIPSSPSSESLDPAGNGHEVAGEARAPQVGELDAESRSVADHSSRAVGELLKTAENFAQSFLLRIAGLLSALLSYAVLIMIFVFFMLLEKATGDGERPEIFRAVEEQIRKYIVMKTVISALTGMATWLVLWFFGVPLAVVFGFLAFLMNFIPNIGPLISCVLPIPFLFLNSELAPAAAITAFVAISLVQFISGNVIETRVMGKSFDISPVVLLLALMFFGLIWGIVGMFIATPLVSIIKIVLEQNRATRPLGEMLAGRWGPLQSGDVT